MKESETQDSSSSVTSSGKGRKASKEQAWTTGRVAEDSDVETLKIQDGLSNEERMSLTSLFRRMEVLERSNYELVQQNKELKAQLVISDVRSQSRVEDVFVKSVKVASASMVKPMVPEAQADESECEDEVESLYSLKSRRSSHHATVDAVALVTMMQATQVKLPRLHNLELESIYKFMLDYKQYELHCPSPAVQLPQAFVLHDELEVIADANLLRVKELLRESKEEFFESMCTILHARSALDARQRMQKIKMEKEDFSLSSLATYNSRFKFHVRCIGLQYAINARDLAKIYVQGLRPKILNEHVWASSPQTFLSAMKIAREVLPKVAEIHAAIQGYRATPAAKTATSQDSKPMHKGESNGKSKTRLSDAEWAEKLKTIECHHCHEKGHFASKCPKLSKGDNQQGGGNPPRTKDKVSRAAKAQVVEVSETGATSRRIRVFAADAQAQHEDEFIRLDGRVLHDLTASDGVDVSVFIDPGANVNTLTREFYRSMCARGVDLPIQSGPALVVDLVGHQALTVSGEMVKLNLEFTAEVPVRAQEIFYILEECAEPLSLGLPSIRSLGIGALVAAQMQPVVESPEEDNVEPFPTQSAAVDFMQEVHINPDFPEYDRLYNIVQKYPKLYAPFDDVGLKATPMTIELKPQATTHVQPCRFIRPKLLGQVKADVDNLVQLGVLSPVNESKVASPILVLIKPDKSLRLAVDYRQLNEVIEPYAGQLPYMQTLFTALAGNQWFAKVDNLWGYYQLVLEENSRACTTIVTPWGMFQFNRCPFGISTAPGVYQDRMANEILKDWFLNGAVVFIDDTLIHGSDTSQFLDRLDKILHRMEECNVRLKPSKCFFGYDEIEFLGHVFHKGGYGLSAERKIGISQLDPPKDVKQLRSFLGMVNYFRNFIPMLSALMSPLTGLTKKDNWAWSEESQAAFEAVKEAVLAAQDLVQLNDSDPLILYTDASTIGVGAVLMQKQDGREMPVIYVSKKFTVAESRWSTTEQECYAMVYAIKQLQPYLLGREFLVCTDHRSLVYLRKSTVPKLVRWSLSLSQYRFAVIHIPGTSNAFADGLSRIFRLKVGENAIKDILCSVHNEVVGHHGIAKTIQLLQQQKLKWPSRDVDVENYILQCPLCQKLKPKPGVDYVSERHLFGTHPMQALSVDTIGPLPADNEGNKYVVVIVDNFSKFAALYPVKSTEAKGYVGALIHHMGTFGVMKTIRSDRGTQFTASICQELENWFKFQHIKIVPYHPEANGIVERKNAEIMKHLRAMVMARDLRDQWSYVLPMIQRILNFSVDRSTGTFPAEIIFGSMIPNDLYLDVELDLVKDAHEHLQELKVCQTLVIEASRQHLAKSFPKTKAEAVAKPEYEVGDFILMSYPNRPPSKLSAKYRGPLLVTEKYREDMYQVRDLITSRVYDTHVSSMFAWTGVPGETASDVLKVAALDTDEYVVEAIIDHRFLPGKSRGKTNMEFRVKWLGYSDEDEEWMPWHKANELSALDDYSKAHPELKLG